MRRSQRSLRAVGVSVDKRLVSTVLLEKCRTQIIGGLSGLGHHSFSSKYLSKYLAEVGGDRLMNGS